LGLQRADGIAAGREFGDEFAGARRVALDSWRREAATIKSLLRAATSISNGEEAADVGTALGPLGDVEESLLHPVRAFCSARGSRPVATSKSGHESAPPLRGSP
jgi:hypothetical protein